MKELATTRDGTTWDTTRWLYDPATGLVVNKVYADTSSVSYTHTPDGKLLRTTWACGEWREHAYTPDGLPSATTYSDATPAVSLVHDAFQHLAAASNAVASYIYANSVLGIATNETATIGGKVHTLTRELDDRHRLAGLALSPLPLGEGRGEGTAPYSVAYAYDNEGRLAVVSNDIFVAEYAYTPDGYDAGYTVRLTDGAVLTRSLVRDTYRRGLIKAITNLVNGMTLNPLAYDYDVLGRPTRRNADTFGYNIRSEVTSATIASNAAIYAYDSIGNHTTSAVNSVATTYTANNLNQYTSILCAPAPLREPSYDLDGNLRSNGLFSYTYDAENRLIAAYSNSVCVVSNAYDHSSRRVLKFTPSATYTFIYDGWNLIQETIQNQQSTITNHYVWGNDLSGTMQGAGGVGGLLAVQLDGTWYIPFYDNNGNITAYVDESGTLAASYTYDAFGATLAQSGPMAEAFPHRFSTKYHDPETGLYYYGYRFYSPSLHRWLNRDPIEEDGGVNLYGVCNNSALKLFDVDGKWTWNEQTAIQEVREKINEMREDGYNFAADALEHYLGNHTTNCDLSRYASEISNNTDWQESFFKSVWAELQKKDPNGTNKKVEIGDIAHKASFDANLSAGNLDNQFTPMFSHRFNPTLSMSLFYALYGSRYSYIGTASWCRKSKQLGVTVFFDTKIKTDLRIVCWDPLSYAGGFPRTRFPSYSAAQYLHTNHGYRYTYIYLKWNEKSNFTMTNYYEPMMPGSFLKRE